MDYCSGCNLPQFIHDLRIGKKKKGKKKKKQREKRERREKQGKKNKIGGRDLYLFIDNSQMYNVIPL